MEATRGGVQHAVFAPMDSMARVEAVARRIGDAIELGLLADGDQLPGESDLAARLGVSTVTLRSSLLILRQQGLVTTRRGRGGGSFVHAPAEPLVERLRPRLAELSAQELRDFGDHHAAVAGAAARLAAARSDADDLQRLRELRDAFEAGSGTAERVRADRRFHVEVAAAAQSARLTREEIRFQTEFGALMCLAFDGDDLSAPAAEQHRALVEAIAAGAEETARDLAERHVQDATQRLIELRLALAG